MTLLDKTFSLLDRWRHLPAYQLERRADIFFAAYLPQILEARFGQGVHALIPEFPVRIGTIEPGSKSNRSVKIDYVARLADPEEVLFIELKTDRRSRRSKQDAYLQGAKSAGMVRLLKGILEIHKATKQKRKYAALLNKLVSAGFLMKRGGRGPEVVHRAYRISIVYVQPQELSSAEETAISFWEIADVLSSNSDELSRRFAQSLREWAAIEPGADDA